MGQEIEPAAMISSTNKVIRELKLGVQPWAPRKILVEMPTVGTKIESSRTKWGGKQQVLRDKRRQMHRVRLMVVRRTTRQPSNSHRLSASLKN